MRLRRTWRASRSCLEERRTLDRVISSGRTPARRRAAVRVVVDNDVPVFLVVAAAAVAARAAGAVVAVLERLPQPAHDRVELVNLLLVRPLRPGQLFPQLAEVDGVRSGGVLEDLDVVDSRLQRGFLSMHQAETKKIIHETKLEVKPMRRIGQGNENNLGYIIISFLLNSFKVYVNGKKLESFDKLFFS